MARIISAALLIPLSLYLIYIGPPISFITGIILAIGILIEWFSLCRKNRLSRWAKMTVILLGTVYLALSSLWLLQNLSISGSWRLLYWLLLLVWSTDTAAYLGGKLLRGPKLAPSISPNKTWSGFVAGMLVGTAVGYEASFWLMPGVFTLWAIALLVLIAQGGDLMESQMKRWSQVKDSGFLIPGHGGLLDRLDSFLAVSFALAFWQVLL